MRITLLYAIFCIIAMGTNIGSQEIALQFWPSFIWPSIVIGTGAGLLVKYYLDKRFIFAFKVKNVSHDSATFALYTLMGIATTAIFWFMEYTFWEIFSTTKMRYLGGMIGLVAGYLIKYHLDKKFVFTNAK